ncbi:MAG: exonuclease domain-containing protein [bacterium]|nr:exonuclease domain-containing protein [bacterium]
MSDRKSFIPTVCYSADRSFIWETLGFPEKILCIDCETTGLDLLNDSIIELGMVWVYIDKIIPVFHSLFKIDKPLPTEIINLTGITDEELSSSSHFHDKCEEILERCEEADTILGHNVLFDLNFLSNELRKHQKLWIAPNYLFDTRMLVRMLYPEAPSGGLAGYSRWFQFHHNPHRALSDALVTAQIFYKCLDRLKWLSKEDCQILSKFAELGNVGFRSIHWEKLKTIVPTKESLNLPSSPWGTSNQYCHNINYNGSTSIDSTLCKNGWIERQLTNFVERKHQKEYAHFVQSALNNKSWTVLEAGTGIGKTFGYLAPIVEWLNEDENRRIIISTYSKTLQEQLFHQDIPKWLDLVPNGSATLLKGRSNYVCRYRFEELIQRRLKSLHIQDTMQASALLLWLRWTQTGDFTEIVPLNESRSFFRYVVADPIVCRMRNCPMGDVDCFFGIQRQNAATSRIVVVNHSLLCYALFHQPNLLGVFEAIIIDEGHRFEEVVRDTLTSEISVFTLRQLREGWSEMTDPLPENDYNKIKSFVDHLLAIEQSWVRFLAKIKDVILKVEENEFGRRLRYSKDGPVNWSEQSADAFENSIKSAMLEIAKLYSDQFETVQSLLVLDSLKNSLLNVLDAWVKIKLPNENYATWFELPPQTDYENVQFFAAPINIGPTLQEYLLKDNYYGVITSATLSIHGNFSFLKRNLGLDTIENVTTQSFPSPFDLDNQLKIIVPMFGADAFDGANFRMDVLNEWLVPALKNTKVNTLVLATSKKIGNRFSQNWKTVFSQREYPVWLQNVDGSPSELLEQFKAHQPSILIGFDSFWEGVDLPGSLLECIIIPRLPFPVPDEPIHNAKSEILKNKNQNDFLELSLPQAILKIRQGIGRMIRKETDYGLVIILDRRLFTKRYGTEIMVSLPVEVKRVDTVDEFNSYFTWILEKKTNENFGN